MQLGVYRHWKGHHYLALFIARDSNNNADHENTVVYVSLDPPKAGQLSVRRESEFLEVVELPGGGTTPRFIYVGLAPVPTDFELLSITCKNGVTTTRMRVRPPSDDLLTIYEISGEYTITEIES